PRPWRLRRPGALENDPARRDGARLQLAGSRSSLRRSLPAACQAGAAPGAHLGEQGGVVLAADRPAPVPQVEARPMTHRVLLRGGEGAQRADVAPVRRLLELLQAGHLVLREIVGVDACALAQ